MAADLCLPGLREWVSVLYSDVFCKVYNEFGWNYYPEIFGQQLLQWLQRRSLTPETALDLGCGTGILCRILKENGVDAWGMDLSAGMIGIAREEDPTGNYEVADMTTYRPGRQFDIVTCTGDALNHISDLADVERIFQNVYAYTAPGGYFVFDILNEQEVSTSEPFEMEYRENMRIWFQMTRPDTQKVELKIRVFEKDQLAFEEVIEETIHAPDVICSLLRQSGFVAVQCTDRLLEDANPGTTWFVIARKEDEA